MPSSTVGDVQYSGVKHFIISIHQSSNHLSAVGSVSYVVGSRSTGNFLSSSPLFSPTTINAWPHYSGLITSESDEDRNYSKPLCNFACSAALLYMS